MIEPDLEDLLNIDSYWECETCGAPFATKELAEKHEQKCYVLEDLGEEVEYLQKILDKNHFNSNELRKALKPFKKYDLKSSSLYLTEEIKSILNTAGVKLSEIEYKEKKLERVKQREKALDYEAAINIWEELGEISEAARVRKLKAKMSSVKIAQKVVQGDEVTEIKDSVLNRSNVGGGVNSKAEELREAKALLDEGVIDDDEFKQMKKEILGK